MPGLGLRLLHRSFTGFRLRCGADCQLRETRCSDVQGGIDVSVAVCAWGAAFVHCYNFDHRHSGIRYVSPAQRHEGRDHAILAARHALYTRARERNPARWSGNTRNCSPIGAVTLNPERDCIIKSRSVSNDIQPLAA